ncbi:hypothetical protein PRIPAC_85939 [Pristionchus pacificus]|uniref:Uncharacterized protein n=1 Tax=Pristionchus pacificus TaxID=54126 RepID=A0A2A6D1I5_PRIPA|nr:hypothetical protein PRIPAC_85939 [Pristionchus pacificus]|eukprot:PDM84161.1 hypothetical protein PRIPAC_35137 [Pristionchus pacificus]
MLPYLILLSSLSSLSSASCGSHPPTDGSYDIFAVRPNRGPLPTVLNEARDEGLVRMAIDSPKEDCDSSCLFTLEHYDAPHHYSSLVVRKELSEFVPFGYTRITNRSTVYCARSEGGCGATVPVWRHFFFNGTGIYHTYTLDDSMVDGYTREGIPLCFVWSQDAIDLEGSGAHIILNDEERDKRNSVMTKEPRPCDVSFPNRTNMEMLTEYKNNRTGTEFDHFYTLKSSKQLSGYNRTKDLGLILTKNDSSCSCLVTLVQTLDNQSGIFHRIDHKLMRSDAELNRMFERYNRTGEIFYCAAKKGQCGSSLPLYKHFDFIHIDSIITTSDKEVPSTSYRYPSDPLCWIWSASYDDEEEGSGETTVDRVKRTTVWEEEETEWTTDGWNTTVRIPSTNATTKITPTPTKINSTPKGNSTLTPSTVRSTTRLSNSTLSTTSPSSPPPTALDEIIVRMVRSALGNYSNWKDAVRRKLREISERI